MNLQNGSAISFLNWGTELPPRVTIFDSERNMTVSEEVSPDISRKDLVATMGRMLANGGPFFRPSQKSLRISLDERLRGTILGT